MIELQENPTGKVGSREHWGPKRTQHNIFKKNRKEIKVRLELFLIEGENNFEEKSIRAQIYEVAYLGSDEFKNWVYDLGINKMLPSDWEEFKEMMWNSAQMQELS
ncbi:hypothetical protein H312_01547 [Anncaliia algerae PRA339]|uniref:Uncharacterized protein n=1 Tax=Anncaliia algerae PRA339 TaxID=1288291 RepID=A0A059F2A2_9MICR|nr:hypothetical protein H312_01547 [Anncaliia algerae PRA339]